VSAGIRSRAARAASIGTRRPVASLYSATISDFEMQGLPATFPATLAKSRLAIMFSTSPLMK